MLHAVHSGREAYKPAMDAGAAILYVGPPRREALDVLERAGLTWTTCPDVYRALARLAHAPTFTAVVVCVDDLGPPEMAFFAQISRLRSGLPVLVCGAAASESRITRAVELGAVGRLLWESLRNLVGENGHQATSVRTLSEALPLAEQSTGIITQPTRTVRVPWLKYTDGASRAGPKRKEERGAPDLSPRSPTTEPLLTPDEMQALIGDDSLLDPGTEGPRGASL